MCTGAQRGEHSKRRQAPLFTALLLLTVVLVAGPATAEDGKEAAAETPAADRVEVVGRATINVHLNAGPPSARAAALIERYRQVAAAHMTGNEPPEPAGPEPPAKRDGHLVQGIPAELMPTMFFHVDGGTYCSDGTVPSPFSFRRFEKEGD